MERFALHFRDRTVQSVLQIGQSKFVQLSFEPGQGLTNHRAPLALTVIVLTGQIQFTAENRVEVLNASEMLTIEPSIEHAVEAIQKSTVLLVLTPDGEVPAVSKAINPPLQHENAYERPGLMDEIAPELRPLVEDHIEVCKVLKSVEDNAHHETIHTALRTIDHELSNHFVVEERVLFPRIANHVGGMDVGPVARLIEEHNHIRQLHAEAGELVSAWARQDDEHVKALVLNKMSELSRALLNHLGKEDSHLFPMASRLLTAEEKEAITEGLRQFSILQ